MLSRLVIALVASLQFATAAEPIPTQRIDIHVDGERPIAGERSRFAVVPNGDIYFTFTLAAGDFDCKPLGIIPRDGSEIELTAIDSESTWNVDGWGTFGFPFDLAIDAEGNLHAATRHRGQPYGVDYWRQDEDGRWQLESFGADVTFGGNNVSLEILPDGKPVVVCLDRNRTHLAVWERSDSGKWTATRPTELNGVASGHFDLNVDPDDGSLHVVFCPMKGGPVCATRDPQGNWTRQEIAPAGVSRSIGAIRGPKGRLHVSFASSKSDQKLRYMNYAFRSRQGEWQSQAMAIIVTKDEHHVGRTDIGVSDSGRIAIAWEKGAGGKPVTKDYGGTVGAVMLTIIDGESTTTHELVPGNGGRPSLALSPDGNTAWVGVYTGNDDGDDFYLLRCRLDGREIAAAPKVRGDAATMFRDGCLKDINSGNPKAELRGLQRIDLSSLDLVPRIDLIERYRDHENPMIRKSIVRGMAAADARNHFGPRLREVLDDPDRLVRKTFLHELGAAGDQRTAQPIVEKALAASDAMTRLSAAEVVRQHPDWISPEALTIALTKLGDDLHSEDLTAAGSAAMALERLIAVDGVGAYLEMLTKEGWPSQRVRAALIRLRTGAKVFDLSLLANIPDRENEQAQLALCGLLGQVRTAFGVPLLKRLLRSPHATVRTAAVFALRSCAHVAELKPVAKHPKGFDILALRPAEPKTPEESRTREAAVAALIEALKHDDPNVREKACDALNRVGATEAAESIAKLQNDPDPGVRIAAETAGLVLAGKPSDALIDFEQWKTGVPDRPVEQLNPVYRQPTKIVDGVVAAGNDKQLLIDDFVIAESTGLTRRLHPFEKHPRNPVFQAQVPWEEGWADPFMSTVLYDPGERCFKMWYRCGPRHSLKAYAVSADGIHWQRPDIAESAWQEFEHHNLLGFEGQIETWKKPGNNVQFFPDAEGTDRYKSLFYQPPTQDYAFSRSADGVRWTQPESVRPAHGDVVSLTWDPARRHYLFFPKYKREHDGFVRRSFAAAALETIDSPFTPIFPFLAGHRDDAQVADGASRAYGSLLPDTLRLADFHSEIYSVTAIPYEGVAVALYDLWPVIGSAEGPLDMPVKISRDLKSWADLDYPNRALSIGRFGEWDSGMVYGGNTLLVVDDEIRLYYLGANMGHCTRVLPTTKPWHTVAVGLATLRLDGFASLGTGEGKDGKPATGEFTTKPLAIGNANRLQINARCHEGGSIRVALLDGKTGKPLPGFTLDDCDPFEGDSVRYAVTWRGNGEIPRDLPETVQLWMMLENAGVFALQF